MAGVKPRTPASTPPSSSACRRGRGVPPPDPTVSRPYDRSDPPEACWAGHPTTGLRAAAAAPTIPIMQPDPKLPPPPKPVDLDAVEQSLLRLKGEMEQLNARLQYLGLMLRLGARK